MLLLSVAPCCIKGSTQHPRGRHSRIIFVEPGQSGIVLHNNIMNDALNIDVHIFCEDICRDRANLCHLLYAPTAFILTSMFNDALLANCHACLRFMPVYLTLSQTIKPAGGP